MIERLAEPEGVVAEGWTAHACVDAATLRPIRLPPWLYETLVAFET